MAIGQQQVTDEQDELIDATIDKMDDAGVFDGFKLVEPPPEPKPERSIKPVKLAGQDVNIEHVIRKDGRRLFRAQLCGYTCPPPDKSWGEIAFTSLISPGPYVEYHYKEGQERQAHDKAMEWADSAAHFNAFADAASSALSREPDIVIEDSDIQGGEYWQKICELADQGGKPREGVYVADITAIMDSPEVSADRGGRHNICEPNHYEYWVRCELLLCLNPCYTGGRWLAVYEVSQA